jgi:hypothetical protein
MPAELVQYTPQEFAERGQSIYTREVEPRTSPADKGKYVAIDIDSGDYELGPDDLGTTDRLRARRPAARVWKVRVGYQGVVRFGSFRTPGNSR